MFKGFRNSNENSHLSQSDDQRTVVNLVSNNSKRTYEIGKLKIHARHIASCLRHSCRDTSSHYYTNQSHSSTLPVDLIMCSNFLVD